MDSPVACKRTCTNPIRTRRDGAVCNVCPCESIACLQEALASATSFLARKEKKNKIAHLDPGIDILHELLTQYDPMDQYTPALRACYSGRVDTLRHILRLLPADATHDSVYMRGGRRANGATCAHLAAEQGYVGILKLLVERFGAESGVLNGINAASRTPCEMAMKHGAVYAPAIRYLAHHGGCRPASAEPGSPTANEQKTRALDVATMCPAVRTLHGDVIRPILKQNSADSRYSGAPGYVYPPGVKVFGATAEHDDVRIHGIPNGPMDTFDPFAHVAAGWRMLSPDQLEAMHLPPDLLVPGARPAVEVDAAAAASTSSSDGNNNENPTVAVIKTLSKFQPLFRACAVDELPPSMLDLGENEMVMERDYLRQSRPFVVRGAYNPSILTQVPEHHPDATRVLEYSRLEGSRVMNQDRLFGIFGRLNVDTGELCDADIVDCQHHTTPSSPPSRFTVLPLTTPLSIVLTALTQLDPVAGLPFLPRRRCPPLRRRVRPLAGRQEYAGGW